MTTPDPWFTNIRPVAPEVQRAMLEKFFLIRAGRP